MNHTEQSTFAEDMEIEHREAKKIYSMFESHSRWAAGENDGERANLHGNSLTHLIDLNGMNLRQIDLSAADLHNVTYKEVNLDGADLTGADLTECSWTGGSIRGAELSGADLKSAFMLEVDASRANLAKANVYYANMPGINFSEAELSGADMRRAFMQRGDFRGAVLRGANLADAELQYATMRGADLRGTDLTGADLTGADLTGAKLEGAILEGTILDGAVLRGTVLDKAFHHPGQDSSAERDRFAEARAIVKQHFGGGAVLTSAQPGRVYSGEIIGILDDPLNSAVMAVSDSQAILHDFSDAAEKNALKPGETAELAIDWQGYSVAWGRAAAEQPQKREQGAKR
jgi:uncharacterized protein YjbI with pentapeptide repeats